jgi:cytochrome c peroxidase
LANTIRLRHSDQFDTENVGRGIPNYLGPAVIAPDGQTAWTPSKQDNIARGTLRDGRNLTFETTVRSIASVINLATNTEDYPARLDFNNGGIASTGSFDRTGSYLFVALEGSREVAVVDAYGKRELFRIAVGRAPQGVIVSADGRKLFVNNFMDRTVSVIDINRVVNEGALTAPVLATMNSVAAEKLSAQVLRGKQFFYDAADTRLARDAYISCASCHNDGGQDGRVWDLTGMGEGLRNTISLRGRSGAQGFQHWSANFDEIQDFEGQIRGLSGGTGLMTDAQFNTGTRQQPLGDRKTGVSADLDALAAYVASLTTFDQSPYRNNGALTSDAAAGREIFRAQNCAQCHSGTAFTEALSGTLRNIGTLKPSSGKRLGGVLSGFDTPTLRDVWATAPYLHDGSAATLEAAITAHNGVSLSTSDLQKLVAYLQQIGSEESSAPTQTTNLAQGRPPRQSSTAYSGAASRAVDGNTNGVYNQNSVTHTNNDTNAWWQVDLGSARTIETIQLFNRTDCCSNRLSNFYVFVSNSDMTGRSYTNLVRDEAVKKYWVSGPAPASLTLNAATSGRYVRVQLSGRNYLSLAEVQVWGR